MDPKYFIRQLIATGLRNLAAPIFVFLIAKGYLTEDETGQLVGIVTSVVIALGWGLFNKINWNKQLSTALKLPKNSPYEDIKKVWS